MTINKGKPILKACLYMFIHIILHILSKDISRTLMCNNTNGQDIVDVYLDEDDMEQPCPAGIVTPWITKIGYFCRYGKKMECSSRTFAFTVDGEYSYITENGGVTSKYCAGLCAKGKNKLATEIQVHTVWKGTITRRNSAKACVQRENTVQTAVGIGMRHHRRNA